MRANHLGHDRFGISTARKLGGAVERNRVRRRIREVLRQLDRTTGDGRDILIVARSDSVDASYEELRACIETLVGPVRTTEAPPAT
jgi:ribonuclease P protein component